MLLKKHTNFKCYFHIISYHQIDTVPNDYVYYPHSPATTVKFEQSTYVIDEDGGAAQPVLVLSNPLSTNITVEVFSTNDSATGKYCNISY